MEHVYTGRIDVEVVCCGERLQRQQQNCDQAAEPRPLPWVVHWADIVCVAGKMAVETVSELVTRSTGEEVEAHEQPRAGDSLVVQVVGIGG